MNKQKQKQKRKKEKEEEEGRRRRRRKRKNNKSQKKTEKEREVEFHPPRELSITGRKDDPKPKTNANTKEPKDEEPKGLQLHTTRKQQKHHLSNGLLVHCATSVSLHASKLAASLRRRTSRLRPRSMSNLTCTSSPTRSELQVTRVVSQG